jgi:hypothetical protein
MNIFPTTASATSSSSSSSSSSNNNNNNNNIQWQSILFKTDVNQALEQVTIL